MSNDLTEQLVQRYGELLSGRDLQHVMGFRSERTFFRALDDPKTFPVPVFEVPGRRGRWVRTRDVATWLNGLGQELK